MYRTAFPNLHFTTGKHVTITSIDFFRIANGKIVAQWTVADMLGMLQQLGAVPAPAGASLQ